MLEFTCLLVYLMETSTSVALHVYSKYPQVGKREDIFPETVIRTLYVCPTGLQGTAYRQMFAQITGFNFRRISFSPFQEFAFSRPRDIESSIYPQSNGLAENKQEIVKRIVKNKMRRRMRRR